MSRSGYYEDYDIDQWQLIRWRGQVASTIRGKNGQAFLKELLKALEAMPEKRLIAGDLIKDGAVCTLGAVGRQRQINMSEIDPEDYEEVAATFGITHQLVREIEWMNDEMHYRDDEDRWQKMHDWVAKQIKEP